jgi:hypothetical protein
MTHTSDNTLTCCCAGVNNSLFKYDSINALCVPKDILVVAWQPVLDLYPELQEIANSITCSFPGTRLRYVRDPGEDQ